MTDIEARAKAFAEKKQKEYAKRYYAVYYQTHKEVMDARTKAWRKAHPEAFAEHQRRYQAKRKVKNGGDKHDSKGIFKSSQAV